MDSEQPLPVSAWQAGHNEDRLQLSCHSYRPETLVQDLATQLFHSKQYSAACKQHNQKKGKYLSLPFAEHLSGMFVKIINPSVNLFHLSDMGILGRGARELELAYRLGQKGRRCTFVPLGQ